MSWFITIPAGPWEIFDTAVDAAVEAAKIPANEFQTHQINAAVTAVKAMNMTGAAGIGLVSASLSGHSNPDHKPRTGYSNDTVQVMVQCAEPYLPRELSEDEVAKLQVKPEPKPEDEPEPKPRARKSDDEKEPDTGKDVLFPGRSK